MNTDLLCSVRDTLAHTNPQIQQRKKNNRNDDDKPKQLKKIYNNKHLFFNSVDIYLCCVFFSGF